MCDIIFNMASTSSPAKVPSGTAKHKVDESFQAYHIGLIIFSVLVIFFNIFAISIYCRHKTVRKNRNNMLLCSLAVSDLLTGLIYLPVLIIVERPDLREKHKWLLTLQRYHYMFGNLCGFSTVFHIIALTIDKYIAVLHPLKRINFSTSWFYRKILLSLWAIALMFAVIPVFWYFEDEESEKWFEKFYMYGIFQLVVFFGLSLLVLLYCYLRMFAKIHDSHDVEASLTGTVRRGERTDRKTISIFLCFFAIFVIGWFPWFLFTLNNDMLHVPLEIKDFLVSLCFAGAALNPAVYAFLKNDYRQAIKLDLGKLCWRSGM